MKVSHTIAALVLALAATTGTALAERSDSPFRYGASERAAVASTTARPRVLGFVASGERRPARAVIRDSGYTRRLWENGIHGTSSRSRR